MKENKKGFSVFVFLTVVMAMAVMISLIIGLFFKYSQLVDQSKEGIGTAAVDVLKSYQKAENPLLYIDASAKIAGEKAVFRLAHNGFFENEGAACGYKEDYALWDFATVIRVGDSCQPLQPDFEKCIPKNLSAFRNYFRSEFEGYIKSYNENNLVKILPNNYDYSELILRDADSEFQIVGKAIDPILIKDENVEYKPKPSFKENIDVDLFEDFAKLTTTAKTLVGTGRRNFELEGLQWEVRVNDCESGNIQACEIRGCCFQACPTCGCESGRLRQYYCSVTAKTDVRIIDERYSTDTSPGYKSMETVENGRAVARDLTYRFAVNWVEMVGGTVCEAG